MSGFVGTPGPWGTTSEGLGPISIRAQNLNGVAEVFPIAPLRSAEGHPATEKLANARLIAAAPELLAALTSFVEGLSGQWHEDDPMLTAGRAAIAKALGAP